MPPKKASAPKTQVEKIPAVTLLDGAVLTFTGFRDSQLQAAVEAMGGRVAASVTKAVTIVVCKTGGETTKKVQDAAAKGLEIMTKDQLKDLLESIPASSSAGSKRKNHKEEDTATIKASDPQVANIFHATSLDGAVLTFTGFRDSQLQAAVEAVGGRVAASVTKAVTIVVCKTGGETTKKVQDAAAKGLEIMTKDQLEEIVTADEQTPAPKKSKKFNLNEGVSVADLSEIGDTKMCLVSEVKDKAVWMAVVKVTGARQSFHSAVKNTKAEDVEKWPIKDRYNVSSGIFGLSIEGVQERLRVGVLEYGADGQSEGQSIAICLDTPKGVSAIASCMDLGCYDYNEDDCVMDTSENGPAYEYMKRHIWRAETGAPEWVSRLFFDGGGLIPRLHHAIGPYSRCFAHFFDQCVSIDEQIEIPSVAETLEVHPE